MATGAYSTRPPDIAIQSLRGGFNDTDPPSALHDDELVQADNVEFFNSLLGERRGGCAALSLASSGLTDTDIAHLSQWFPTPLSPTTPEILAVSVTPSTSVHAARRDTSGVWHTLSPNDAINNTAPDVFSIVQQALDGVAYLAYHGTADRLKAWDGTNWRYAGLAQPGAAPTATDTGAAGAFTGVRYYRVRYVVMSGSVVLRRSEPSAVLTFTPNGAKSGAVVTKPASIGENETHWELEASLDNANFYRIARTVVGTTTVTDTAGTNKAYPPVVHVAPTSTDGTGVTYVLLSNTAAQLNLTGTVSNGVYAPASGTIAGRGWIGYDGTGTYIAAPGSWGATQNWYASPDVATALEAASSTGTSDYASIGTLSDAIGAYLTIPSARYLAVDGDRLIYASHWTDATKASMVGWTPKSSDPGAGNSERAPIVTTGGTAINTTANLDNYDGGPITGIAATSYGNWYAFKWQRIYVATRSLDVTNAYDINTTNTTRGALPGSVVRGSDNAGNPVVFFLDPNVGPCVLSSGGVVNVIRGLRKTWKRVNVAATTVICCGVYYPYKQQVIWMLSVDGANTPSLGIKLQASELVSMPDGTLGRGWSFITGKLATAQCAAAITFASGNQTTDIPFFGLPGPFIVQSDTGTDDVGTAFTATIKTKPNLWAGLLNRFGIMNATILATAANSTSVSVSLIRDEGAGETVSSGALSLAPTSSEPEVLVPIDNLSVSDNRMVQVLFTDGVTGENWALQRLDMHPRAEGNLG